MKDIASKIKSLRLESGLNQKDFGDKVGLAQAAVSSIESGVRNPSKKTLKRISEVFDVDFKMLTELRRVNELNKSNSTNNDYTNIVRFLSNQENAYVDISRYVQKLYRNSIDEIDIGYSVTFNKLLDKRINNHYTKNSVLHELWKQEIYIDVKDKDEKEKREILKKQIQILTPLLIDRAFVYLLVKSYRFDLHDDKGNPILNDEDLKEKQRYEKQVLDIFYEKVNNDEIINILIKHNIVKPSELMNMQKTIEDSLTEEYIQKIRKIKA